MALALLSDARFSSGTALPKSGAAGAIEKDDGVEPEPDDALPIEFDSVATGTRCGAMREPAPDSESEKECGAAEVEAEEAVEPWPALSVPLLLNKGAAGAEDEADEEEEEGPCEVEKRAADADRAATRAADVDAEKEPPVVG